MIFDMGALPPQDRYKIMTATIVPRPIAWITTLSRDDVLNAAPFSFFNMMGNDPPTVAIGIMSKAGLLKDTAANILETGEFVVNLVAETDASAMNLTCIDAPPEVDELALAGLEAAASSFVAPPRIRAARVAFECQALTSLVTGPLQTIVIGRVLCAHVEDRFVLDAERCHIDTPALELIARMHGGEAYLRTSDLFHLKRPSWAERRGQTPQDESVAGT
ncbi:flavin reductase family protein [Boseaceae bacterium BT-24-1]|nr:flavin reductase family protein [Boseaceae bacterium BT-24-1]